MKNPENKFRFQELAIWHRAATASEQLFRLADSLEQRRLFKFAEQLRGATLSITNNIAEGSGSISKAEFANFLNMARRSVFEVANILAMKAKQKYLPETGVAPLLTELDEQSRMILAFMRQLKH